jgi:glucose/arabinose dehydrogenase
MSVHHSVIRAGILVVSGAASVLALTSALAQQPAAPQGGEAKPAEPPRWMQGQPPEMKGSTLAPIAPHLTGRPAKDLPISKLKVPAGFSVEVYVDGIPDARSLTLGDKGTVFVSNRNLKDIYAVVDRAGKREVRKVLSGLEAPNGVAFKDGTLYVAEHTRILAYQGIENQLDNPPQPRVVIDGLPRQVGHFWKYISFGPDGKLYFNIGAPGNIVMPGYIQGSISRVDVKTGKMEQYAVGVRNSVGFDWHPQTKQLWFTEHGRDWMGDDMPSDELNKVSRPGEHFGYPFCHQGDTLDPEFGKYRSCSEFTPPALNLGAHIAPLGMRFYTGSMFPAEYRNSMFIAQHGSWNRTVKHGYNVIRVTVDNSGKVVKSEPFLEGFLTDPKANPPTWGRPVDVLFLRDGSMLVSDDFNGIIYRISYKK